MDGNCNSHSRGHEDTDTANLQQQTKDDTPVNPYDSGTEGSDSQPVNPYPACNGTAPSEPILPSPAAEGNGPLLCDVLESQGPTGQQEQERGDKEVKLNGSACVNGQEGPTSQEAPKEDPAPTSEADPSLPTGPEGESLKDGQ